MGGRGFKVVLFGLLVGWLLISDSQAERPKHTKLYEVLEVDPEASMGKCMGKVGLVGWTTRGNVLTDFFFFFGALCICFFAPG